MNNFKNTENLQLIPATHYGTTYCRHCGKKVSIGQVSAHLVTCRPIVHDAIQKEYDLKEAFAMQIAAN